VPSICLKKPQPLALANHPVEDCGRPKEVPLAVLDVASR
jgi:hypothetical protein